MTLTPVTDRPTPRLRAWAFAWLVVVSLLAAQVLGLVHRVAHAGPGSAAIAVAQALSSARNPSTAATNPAANPAAAPSDTREAWPAGDVARLFAGHADDAGCRLYDALGHAAPASLPLLALPLALAPAPVALAVPDCPAHKPVGFDARGPPAQD